MAKRVLIAVAALLLVALGAAGAWLALTVPNDLRAGQLLKEARTALEKGERPEARILLEKAVRQYPRTDAAATAVQILFHMTEQDRAVLAARVAALEKASKQSATRIGTLEAAAAEAAKAAAKPPPPPPQAEVKKAAPAKKVVPKKAPVRRRRR